MKRCPPLWSRAVWAGLLVSLLAVSAYAQTTTGNIFGTAKGTDEAVLPGVTVTLTGVGAPQTTVSDTQGRFRFINLSPGMYSLKAELAGYGTASRSGVTINIGRNAEVQMTLNPSVSQTITVTAEAPLLDTRRAGTGAVVTEVELEEIPTARDPWVILQQIPGVLMDRINVGGNESGQQSTFVSKGITQDEATFSVDGVNITDMIATGSSSVYYDFGAFEEIQVTTGGTDPRVQTPGSQINIVTKRGTNDFSGSARYYLTPGDYQSDATVPQEAAAYLERANEIDEVTEWGLEAGGPIIRDRLWLWAAYADQQIDLFVAQPFGQSIRYTDLTTLKTMSAKLNAQIMRNNSATIFYTDNQKNKIGRDAGPQRPPETTWNQGAFGPRGTYKIEDTHVFNSNFYLTGMYSKVNGGFYLAARSGADCKDPDCIKAVDKAIVLDANTGAYRNSYFSPFGERPQEQTRLDGSAFFGTGNLNHELKFGFGYRTAGTESQSVWPQNQYIIDFGGGFGLTYFAATDVVNYDYEYNDIYLGDTMLWGNLTLQAGLRFDTQKATAGDQFGPANPIVPDFLPQLQTKGGDIDTMEWESISPRLGLTWALGQDKRALLRASYNRYVGQLGSITSGYDDLIPVSYRYVSFFTLDENGNDLIETGEVLYDYSDGFPVGWNNIDPNNPSSTSLATRVDPHIDPPLTDEFILGGEYELFTDLVVGLNFTHREMDHFVGTRFEKTRGAGDYITAADYVFSHTITKPPPPEGTPPITEVDPYSIDVYVLAEGISPTNGVLTNLPGYSQTYDGLELSLVKRMSRRWMLRSNLSWNDWKQDVDRAFRDPTPNRSDLGCDSCDGSEVVEASTGSGNKGGVWIDSDWALNLAGVYQIPIIETNVGASFTMRQGYPILYVHNTAVTEAGSNTKDVLIGDVAGKRLDNPYSLDLRLSKDFRFKGVGLEVALDAFNVTNERTILQRDADLTFNDEVRDAHNRITELQSPRVFRAGVRLTF